MYRASKIPFGELEIVRLLNEETGEYADIVPGWGATINALALRNPRYPDGPLLQIIDGSSDYDYLITEGTSRYKGSFLFPFPNRIKDGKYRFDGQEYQLPINHPSENNALHGFAYNKPFDTESLRSANDMASVFLIYETDGTDEGWPFKSEITQEIAFSSEFGLVNTITVYNIGDNSFPVGVGVHPYFKLGSSIDKLNITIPESELLHVDERLIPLKTSEKSPYGPETALKGIRFDSCFQVAPTKDEEGEEEVWKSEVSLYSEELQTKLVLTMETSNNSQFLQIYTPPGRETIALEPMTCAPDAFNNGLGLDILKPNDILSITWYVKLV